MRAIPVDIQTACCCCWKRNVVLQKVNFSETTKKEKHFSLMNIAFIHSWKSPHLKLTVRLKCRSDSTGQIQGHLTLEKKFCQTLPFCSVWMFRADQKALHCYVLSRLGCSAIHCGKNMDVMSPLRWRHDKEMRQKLQQSHLTLICWNNCQSSLSI